MKWTTTVKAIGSQLGKSKKFEKIEPASQFEEAAEQFQLVKKGKKVSWKSLDCQDELHRSVTYNKFTTLTLGEEEQEFDEVLASIGDNCSCALNAALRRRAKRKVRVRESPVGGCVKNSSDAQPAWRRVSIAIDSGACDSVISLEHVPYHEVHESVESQRGENFLIWETFGCHCT